MTFTHNTQCVLFTLCYYVFFIKPCFISGWTNIKVSSEVHINSKNKLPNTKESGGLTSHFHLILNYLTPKDIIN